MPRWIIQHTWWNRVYNFMYFRLAKSYVGDGCVHGSISLVGGDSELEGMVLVCISGQWGAVCDDLWDVRDAAVICRQLGDQMGHNDNVVTGL